MKKDELREEMRRSLRGVDATSRARASEHICRAIEQHPAWRDAAMRCAFVPLATEPQIQPLWLAEPERVLCFPRMCGAEIELIRIDERATLAHAGWKLDAPEFAAHPRVGPAGLDVILVPGLAFTRDGRRLGRGGGFYDRLLARCPPHIVKIGVCFSTQLRDELPTESHDRRVDEVITDA